MMKHEMHYLLPDSPGVPQCRHDEALERQTSVSPVMLVIVKVGFWRYLGLAIDSVRTARDPSFSASFRRQETLSAIRTLGIAEGYVNVLFDAPCAAYRYQRVLDKVKAAVENLPEQDITLTARLSAAGELLGIRVAQQ